jgi:tetratricopeptide (TPR) repeat protein
MNKLGRSYYNIGKDDESLSLFCKTESLILKISNLPEMNDYAVKKELIAAYTGIGRVHSAKGSNIKAIGYFSKGLKIAEKYKDLFNIYSIMRLMGGSYSNQGNYPMAVRAYQRALALSPQIGNDITIESGLHNNLGNNYWYQSDYPKAIEHFLLALQLAEKAGNKEMICMALNNVGVIYDDQGEKEKAREYYERSLPLYEEVKDYDGICIAFTNLGESFHEEGNDSLALAYYMKGLAKAKEIKSKEREASAIALIGEIMSGQGKFSQAEENICHAIKIQEEISDNLGLMGTTRLLSKSYLDLYKSTGGKSGRDKLPVAFELVSKALEISKAQRNQNSMIECYKVLSDYYDITNNYKESLKYFKLSDHIRDSLNAEENTRKTVQAEMNYTFDKKEQEAKAEQEQKDIATVEESQKQKNIRNLFIIAFGFMLLLAFFIFRSNRAKHRAHEIISKQKKEVERQKELVEEKQQQIMSSINYARRIQESILTHEEDIKKILPNIFIYYSPKDIVSGDFYWASDLVDENGKQKESFILALADCTGHGIPGAFLSMVGSTVLNAIVNHDMETDPARIISQLSKGVHATFVNKDVSEQNNDGMDIAICSIDTKNKKVNFAAANHFLYKVNKQGLYIVEPQINSLNGIFDVDHEKNVRSIEIAMEPDTMIYLSTDGYVDQVGGKNNKKFLSSRFESMLTEIYHLPLPDQKKKLAYALNEWRGQFAQTDDVLVIGFKMP